MTNKRQLGIVLMVAFLAGFVAWNLQPVGETGNAMMIRNLVGGVLAAGAALSWAFLVRKRPVKKL